MILRPGRGMSNIPGARPRIWVPVLLAAAALAWSLTRALSAAWLCDDSFISFRYAEHLVRGEGLVYNVGEYVEGYTNLLWTLLLAAGMALGIPPETSATVLGIAFWLALVAVLALHSRRPGARRPFAPLAAALVLLMDDYQTWATGGLETSLFSLLSVGGLLLAGRPCRGRGTMALAGSCLAAAVATRPDGVIFAAVGIAGAWFVNNELPARRRLALVAAVALPLTIAGAALVAFKLLYYGELFPTAFYSKSALNPYYGQGLFYVGIFLKKHWFIPALAVLLAVGHRGRLREALSRGDALLLAASAVFLGYVAHSGGDFMFARRVLPAMPLLFVVLEALLVALPGRPAHAVGVGLVALGVLTPWPLYSRPGELLRGVANEPDFYPASYVAMRKTQGRMAAQTLGHLPVRAAFEGGMCMFGYYSKLPYLVEMTGLTQYSLAKTPLAARGPVGHEKAPDDGWLRRNAINFVFLQALPPLSRGGAGRADEISFGDILKAKILLYDDAVMDRLRQDPNVRFTPIETRR